MFFFPHSMHIQRVHGEVIWVHVEAVENLLEGHLLSILFYNQAACFSLVCFLDEGQQVLLRHACSCMNMRVNLEETNNLTWFNTWLFTLSNSLFEQMIKQRSGALVEIFSYSGG